MFTVVVMLCFQVILWLNQQVIEERQAIYGKVKRQAVISTLTMDIPNGDHSSQCPFVIPILQIFGGKKFYNKLWVIESSIYLQFPKDLFTELKKQMN